MTLRTKALKALNELETPLKAVLRRTVKTEPDKIVFMTNTFTYTCNPKYIFEKLREKAPDLKIVWLTRRDDKSRERYPEYVRTVPVHSIQGIKEAYSAKIWIDNGIAFSSLFEKKKDQIHIQTMHGSLGIKRLDNAVNDRQKNYIGRREIRRESELTDYVITNSKFEEDVFRTVFWKHVPMVRLGHARTDILFSEDQEVIIRIREELYKRYGIPKENKIVLYGPTHRIGFQVDLDFEILKEALEERFGGTFSVIVRFHSMTFGLKWKNDGMDYIYDLSDYPDMQELMLVTDVGVTDYSSWIYDYVVTSKPGFIYASDLEKYNNRTGFCYPLEETPFPVAKTNEELIRNIKEFDQDKYETDVQLFLAGKEAMDDGHSAERIADWILSLLNRQL